MMLVISTQVYENYAWVDGELQTGPDAYWKAKGGSEYKVLGIPTNVDPEEIVSMVKDQIEVSNDGLCEMIISWSIEEDDYLSSFEKSQLEYEGEIMYPEPVIEYGEVNDYAE